MKNESLNVLVTVEVTPAMAGLMCQATATMKEMKSSGPGESVGISYADSPAAAVASVLRQVADYLTPEKGG